LFPFSQETGEAALAFGDWSTDPASNTNISGVNVAENCPPGNINNAIRQMAADLRTAVPQMASGTACVFYQAAAPTGWTKSTTNNDKALRVVSGTSGGSAGGSVAFSTAFTSRTVSGTTDPHTLTLAEIPAHQHGDGVVDNGSFAFSYGSQSPSVNGASSNITTNSGTGTVEGLTESKGGGGSHTHDFSAGALDLAVQYCDVIVATRNA
jgi:hypothetical protein